MNKKLRISHFPQVPCKPFNVEVKNLKEAKLLYDVLANYDLFQFNNNIKPDYANATVIEEWDEAGQEWLSWIDEETGIDDIKEYFEMKNDLKNLNRFAVALNLLDEDIEIKTVFASSELEAILNAVNNDELWRIDRNNLPFSNIDEAIDFYLQGHLNVSKPILI